MNFLTTGDIAKQLNQDRDTVAYALRKLNAQPIGRAGQVRLFPRSSIEQVREFIEAIKSKRKDGSCNA
jgi:predicted transcriptional regulator